MKEVTIGLIIIVVIVYGMIKLPGISTRSACAVFSKESNRETKVVYYGFGNYDCLTPGKDGKWISAYNLRDN